MKKLITKRRMPSKRLLFIPFTNTDETTTNVGYYYANQYDSFILSVIPSTYREHYARLSADEKERALGEVTELLHNIHLRRKTKNVLGRPPLVAGCVDEGGSTESDSTTEASFNSRSECSHQHHNESFDNVHSNLSSYQQPQEDDESFCSSVEMERRALGRNINLLDDSTLLSPAVLRTPIATTTHLNHDDDSIDPPSNVEEEDEQNSIVRRKRNATTSGKKGSDLQRLRIHHTLFDSHNECNESLLPNDDLLRCPFSPLSTGSTTDTLNGIPGKRGDGRHSLSLLLLSQSPIAAAACDTTKTNTLDEIDDVVESPEKLNRSSTQEESFIRKKGNFMRAFQNNINLNKSRFGIHDKEVGGTYVGDEKLTDDTIQTIDCTVVARRRQLRLATLKQTTHPTKPIGVNFTNTDLVVSEPEPIVQLKKGVCFRMAPLQVMHQRHYQPLEKENRGGLFNNSMAKLTLINKHNEPQYPLFPDPINTVFSSRTAERLNHVVSWMLSQEKNHLKPSALQNKTGWENYLEEKENISFSSNEMSAGAEGSKGILLSLSISQIQAVTLKFLNHSLHSSRGVAYADCSTKSGGVLLVLREKGTSMVTWERLFREKSSLSLLNHSSLSGSARKQLSPSRIAGFDIVLTTFDVIKAKEKTFTTEPVYDSPIIENTIMDQGSSMSSKGKWLDATSSSGDPIKRRSSKQLSCLHGLRWNKVIFVDTLGPQNFSLKINTARAAAGKSLVARSR